MNTPSILDHLARPDKWYLGGGNRLVWTPSFPVWLDHLGFWDKASYYHLDLEPGYTITLLDEDDREIDYRFEERRWRPDGLTQHYRTAAGLVLTERKTVHPADALQSILTLENNTDRPRTLKLVCWTVQPSYPARDEDHLSDVAYAAESLRFVRNTRYRNDPHPYTFGCALGLDQRVRSFAATLSQGRVVQPHWRHTPFYEALDAGDLGDALRTGTAHQEGVLYLGLLATVTLPPNGRAAVTCGMAVAPTTDEAAGRLGQALADDGTHSTNAWNAYFDRLPAFSCSDPFIETYYWYRWYGLRLFTLAGGEGNYPYPAVCEGPDYFRVPITYSAQCHMLETRWMDTPALGQGSLLNFIHNRNADGGFVGHLYLHGRHEESFYHANWAHAWDLHRNHPDEAFLRTAYDGLAAYARHFDAVRDREGSGLYDILNQYETGQEYMHRYVAVAAHADDAYWGDIFRLKGVDVTVYLYEIKQMLARIAHRFGLREEAAHWEDGLARTRRAVREQLWDPDAGMFFDVDPRTGTRTGVKAAVCFYPYLTDLVDERHLPGLKKNLLDPDTFWTPFPVASSSRDDPYFNAWAQWKGQRMNCPWNGRVWPMVNSHLAEVLARTALRFRDEALRHEAARFIARFIRMMFHGGEVGRPNCYEHYNPLTGKACRYRGIDDYQHSWVVELIIKYVCGIRPHDAGVIVDPLPFDLENFYIHNVPVRGHRLGVARRGTDFTVWVDREPVATHPLGTPLHLTI